MNPPRDNFMDRKKIIKKVLIAVLAIAVLIIGYSVLSSKPQGSSPVATVKNNNTTSGNKDANSRQKLIKQGDEIVRILKTLNEIDLEVDFLSDPAFLSLNDSSVLLPQKEIGKKNPFSPLVPSDKVSFSKK